MNKPLDMLTNKGKKPLFILLFILIIITVSLACNLPFNLVWVGFSGVDQEGTDRAGTVLAETMTAMAPDLDEDTTSGSGEEVTTDEEQPQEPPSLTPSPTYTNTPEPQQVSAYVSKNTNCRLGPKDVYELLRIFTNGDVVELLGKNQEDTFWYVQDNDGGPIKCWIWREYATPDADTANLPIFTPPPSPIPSMNYVLSYKQTSGKIIVHVNVQNTGTMSLQSYTATFKDTVTSETKTWSSNKFGYAAKISVGNTGVVSSPEFSANTTGHQMKVTIKVCTEDAQLGKCTSKTINFQSQK